MQKLSRSQRCECQPADSPVEGFVFAATLCKLHVYNNVQWIIEARRTRSIITKVRITRFCRQRRQRHSGFTCETVRAPSSSSGVIIANLDDPSPAKLSSVRDPSVLTSVFQNQVEVRRCCSSKILRSIDPEGHRTHTWRRDEARTEMCDSTSRARAYDKVPD